MPATKIEKIASIQALEAIAHKRETIQSLWSDYGSISRYQMKDDATKTLIVKHVTLPETNSHPRGWNSALSHQRKVRSYQIECHWYEHYSRLCPNTCQVPALYGTYCSDHEFLMIMEDLDQNGFPLRKSAVTVQEMTPCLKWLAYFHALFMLEEPEGLWEQGSYWHLATRPDELDALDDLELKKAASAIDKTLENTAYKTIIHGDAKLANFCFSEHSESVAAVDFQYVGGGCGMKDVAYFIGSCLEENECRLHEQTLLDEYFLHLQSALSYYHPHIDSPAVINDWRKLYPFAWADFHRFVKGWSPGHWKIHSYSETLTKQVIDLLKKDKQSNKEIE